MPHPSAASLPFDMRYCALVPRRREIPVGHVLVHNSVRPVAHINGRRGSRFWTQLLSADLVRCGCGWASELGEHFRVGPKGDRP